MPCNLQCNIKFGILHNSPKVVIKLAGILDSPKVAGNLRIKGYRVLKQFSRIMLFENIKYLEIP